MHRLDRQLAAGALAATLALAALVAPQIASATTKTKVIKVNVTLKTGAPPSSPTAPVSGTLVGTPTGSYNGAVVPPDTKYVWKLTGGTIKITFAGTVSGATVSGPWHVTGGTGKYKHAKGSGTETGGISAGGAPFKMKGTIKY